MRKRNNSDEQAPPSCNADCDPPHKQHHQPLRRDSLSTEIEGGPRTPKRVRWTGGAVYTAPSRPPHISHSCPADWLGSGRNTSRESSTSLQHHYHPHYQGSRIPKLYVPTLSSDMQASQHGWYRGTEHQQSGLLYPRTSFQIHLRRSPPSYSPPYPPHPAPQQSRGGPPGASREKADSVGYRPEASYSYPRSPVYPGPPPYSPRHAPPPAPLSTGTRLVSPGMEERHGRSTSVARNEYPSSRYPPSPPHQDSRPCHRSTFDYRRPHPEAFLSSGGQISPLVAARHQQEPQRSVALVTADDRTCLSAYQTFVRQQLEFFEASETDVDWIAQGRKKKVVMGQVGVRCRHCARLPIHLRSKGSVYYPSKLQNVYQAAQNMAVSHLSKACDLIDQRTREQLDSLRQRRDTAAGGKSYWASSCKDVGVHETEEGLRFTQAINDSSRGDDSNSRSWSLSNVRPSS